MSNQKPSCAGVARAGLSSGATGGGDTDGVVVPRIPRELRLLIGRIMARENFLWGAPRIHGELLMLGFKVSQATMSRYTPPPYARRGRSWRTFLRNQLPALPSGQGADGERIHARRYSLSTMAGRDLLHRGQGQAPTRSRLLWSWRPHARVYRAPQDPADG